MARTPNTDTVDKQRLKVAATDLINELEAKAARKPLRFVRNLQLEISETGGWFVKIGTMGSGLPSLQVFLDRMNGGEQRHFWFGFAALKLAEIAKTIDACTESKGNREIRDSDLHRVKGGHLSLTKHLTKDDTGLPVPEFYFDEKLFYFGIYDLEGKSVDVERAAKFFVPTIRKLLKADIGQVELHEIEFFKRLNRDRQPKFRNAIFQAYDGACALTGCKVAECLEAAHLDRFANTLDNRVTNGVLLRADIHRLIDARLMTFMWAVEGVTAKVNASVKEKEYRGLDGAAVKLPDDHSCWPSKASIERHASGL